MLQRNTTENTSASVTESENGDAAGAHRDGELQIPLLDGVPIPAQNQPRRERKRASQPTSRSRSTTTPNPPVPANLSKLITSQSLKDPQTFTSTIASQIQSGHILDFLRTRLSKCESPKAILLLCHFMDEHFGSYIDARREIKGVRTYRLDSRTVALCLVVYAIVEILEGDERKKVAVRKYWEAVERMQDELEGLEDDGPDRISTRDCIVGSN
ncbi:hypothetical protein BDV06DRAFT_224178 [Aspergillus oleicola]